MIFEDHLLYILLRRFKWRLCRSHLTNLGLRHVVSTYCGNLKVWRWSGF
jgi:hypothetical protein